MPPSAVLCIEPSDVVVEAATFNIPTRDSAVVLPAIHRGFAPLVAVAVRPHGKPLADPAPSVTVRSARPDDIDVLVRLADELHAADAQFGVVTRGPSLEQHLRDSVAAADGLTVVAEGDGQVVGCISAESPQRAQWMSAMVEASPSAYLAMAYVDSRCRAVGVGSDVGPTA